MRVSDRVIEIVQDLECRHQGTDLSINGRTLTGVLHDIAKRARVEEDARSSLRAALNGVAGFWRENKLDDIVEQIEREQGGRVSRMRVLSVVTEMERHCLGHEGMEDSPVAHWARELREALGGDVRDPAADVSVSAYDLLPEEDREAAAWVRKHGGLDYVKSEWRSRVLYDRYERRRQRLLGHIAECETALGRRREIISELNHRASDLTRENAELRKRAMPEGMEWPRYESGEIVQIGDDVVERFGDDPIKVRSVEFRDGTTYLREGYRTDRIILVRPGERVKRAAVPAADGKPLREGEHVYHVETGTEFVVKKLPKPGEYQAVVVFALPTSPASHLTSFDPDRLTHERPENKCRDCAHWQKDPTADKMGVCWFFYHEHEGQDCYAARRADIGACEEFMPHAKALAERGA